MVFHKDLEANQFVFPNSGYHQRIDARTRLAPLLRRRRLGDAAAAAGADVDPLRFRDERRYTERLKAAKAKTGLDDAVMLGAGYGRRRRARRRGAGFRLHGRLARHGRGGGDHRRRGGRGRAPSALRALRRLRRRAHAGGHPLADAAAAHHHRHRHGEGRGAPLYRRPHQPDDRRRHRLLRHARRRASRRARRARSASPARASSSRPSARSCRRASSAPNICSSTAWSTSSCIATSCARRWRGSAG